MERLAAVYLPDGYAAGRDELTGNATVTNGTISALTNRSEHSDRVEA